MRNLPPFHSYPILSKETLVPPNHSPSRTILAVVRLTFGYPHESLIIDSAKESVKILRPGPYKPRSYTPTSAPLAAFALTVKIYPGGSSEWLAARPVGSYITVFGPLPLAIKRRVYAPAERAVVIALGIGITLGIAAAKKELTAGRPVVLVRCVRFLEERVFDAEIDRLTQQFGNMFRVSEFVTGEEVEGADTGRVDEPVLREFAAGEGEVRFLVVGTKGMMREVWRMLRNIGFPYETHALVRK